MKPQIILLGAITVVSVTLGCKNLTPPVWRKQYTVEGEINIPYAEVNEPFQAWYDVDAGCSRIDYYDGTAKILNFNSWPSENGSIISIVPVTTEEYLNKRTCFQTNGKKPGSVLPQSVLPDLTNFKCAGPGKIKGVNAQKWVKVVKIQQKMNKYVMWIKWKDANGSKIPIPVYYEMKGYNTLMGSHFDHYYLTYYGYKPLQPPKDVFDLPLNAECGNKFEEKQHVALHHTMKEFIEGHDKHHLQAWEEFVNKHKKTYKSPVDHAFRKHVFKHNARFIDSHNRADHGYKLEINHLADRTDDELRVLRGRIFSKGSGNGGLPFPYPSVHLTQRGMNLPENFDWRLYGAVNPVKDQSICGSCWSFGTTGTIEGAYFVKTGDLISLSEQALVDCSWGFGNVGCDGGEDFRAYSWIMKHGGLPLEGDYGPYLAIDGMCHVDQVKLHAPISGWVNVTSRSESALKLAIFEKGPISISVDASRKTFSFYSHGVYYEPKCTEDQAKLDHSVLAVGYGTLDGKKYWLVKNSWSNMWGNDGYILISVDRNDCGVTSSPTYVILE